MNFTPSFNHGAGILTSPLWLSAWELNPLSLAYEASEETVSPADLGLAIGLEPTTRCLQNSRSTN